MSALMSVQNRTTMDFAFNLFCFMAVIAIFCAALCVMGAIIELAERIPALGKVFEKFAGWLLK